MRKKTIASIDSEITKTEDALVKAKEIMDAFVKRTIMGRETVVAITHENLDFGTFE